MTDWTPRYIVRKADGVGGPPIPDDEPVLVIRAQDVLAEPVLLRYIADYMELSPHDPNIVSELQRHYKALTDWQQTHPTKVADR